MSYYLIDLDTLKDQYIDIDNILISKKIIFDDITKYYLYYIEFNDAPKEIYIKIPKVRLIYNIFNSKFKQIYIPIYPLWDKTINTINFIKYLEESIFDAFSNYTSLIKSSIIQKKNNIDCLRVNINSQIANNLAEYKINSEYEFVIKISYIWKKDNKIGLDSELYQINYIGTPVQNKINFFKKNQQSTKMIEILPENNNLQNNNEHINPKVKLSNETKSFHNLIPSLSDLIIMKSKLKKI
jgi:hypothetical protein